MVAIPRLGLTYDTISGVTIYKALHAEGGVVDDWMDSIVQQLFEYSKALTVERVGDGTGMNNPLNAGHRGGVVGTYLANWGWDSKGTNRRQSQRRFNNSSPHADIVEFGRPYVRRRQVFTWKDALGPGTFRNGRWYRGEPRPGGEVSTPRTRARRGQHIVRDATRIVAATEDIRFYLN